MNELWDRVKDVAKKIDDRHGHAYGDESFTAAAIRAGRRDARRVLRAHPDLNLSSTEAGVFLQPEYDDDHRLIGWLVLDPLGTIKP